MDGKAIVHNWIFQLCLNGTLATETFMFVSGFLSSLCFARRAKELGFCKNALLMIANRVWRTGPMILVAIALAIIAPLMGSGPVWSETVNPAADKCRRNWLATLLFYSNIWHPQDSVRDY